MSIIACCTGCRIAPRASPSTVRTSRPTIAPIGSRQAFIANQRIPPLPSGSATATVQAPQSPSPQPSLVPVRRCRLSQRNSDSFGSASSSDADSELRRKQAAVMPED
ncbi:MAG: hypothetical protein LKM32_00175 [Chiayiivirga sp.]|nr:hypothetical protein [Chiayiivirga sp.]MCI1727853.1 hypothetical protein [Chiayiivirga sp.]